MHASYMNEFEHLFIYFRVISIFSVIVCLSSLPIFLLGCQSFCNSSSTRKIRLLSVIESHFKRLTLVAVKNGLTGVGMAAGRSIRRLL